MCYHRCIDLSEHSPKIQSVTQVMRTRNATGQSYDFPDAIYLAAVTYPGSMNTMSEYRSYLRTRQIKNTLATDLSFIHDESESKLYINAIYPEPTTVTLAYIPKLEKVEEINSTYWEDILVRLSLGMAKETLGRIRGKYVLNNALYNLDADQLLQEGTSELAELRQHLQANSDLVLPMD